MHVVAGKMTIQPKQGRRGNANEQPVYSEFSVFVALP